MRLVGASGFYFQAPFLLEAAVAGLIGGTTVRRTHTATMPGIAALPASG